MGLSEVATLPCQCSGLDEKALAVVTRAQNRRVAQQRKDAIETCEENPEEEISQRILRRQKG